MSATFTHQELEQKLGELIRKHDVPGAQLAVLDGDAVTEVAAGVLSLRTGAPTTTDALFLPGSIGKLYTATLVMMLVDEGKLDLDTPIRTYLPDFEVADHHARDTVTARDLLTHTSGFDGDHFTDTGRGDDALAKYVAGCADLPQIAPPGLIWSYSNSGYSILGRVVEVLMGTPFEEALRERIFTPLGLQHSVCFADEAIVHPVSVGHVPDPEDPATLVVSPTWGLWRAFAPMGSALVASAGDVLKFTQLHLDGGVAPDGTRLLDAGLAASMLEQQVALVDDTVLGQGWGLGWILDHWGEVSVVGHDGNSIGQNAFMRVNPEERFGFCLQTNVESALNLYRELADWLYGRRLGVGPRPDPAALEDVAVTDPDRYTGSYHREGLTFEIRASDEGHLLATVTPSHGVAQDQGWPPMIDLPLVPVVRDDSFLLKLPIADADLLAAFFNPDEVGGRPTYMHFGGRAHRRV
ncbi:serine hydrolase [Nocardioides sp. cx-173]|uniref:serine hydrolase domain-containing protein n=1 Tax=Nocardioides sp. cx-173 TaxID=2898796 RepID=UPI001E38C6DB|nr:serine hydrolase domain-containing protein [Nocardioides sp. cx-173]MCD4524858.1 beta-lactamase family protein [Nocardioides sp. cx-173]UGB43362.1 beta-lactamase family protein [Nocardioides sp. cx-173]